jgi:hypothetical protein
MHQVLECDGGSAGRTKHTIDEEGTASENRAHSIAWSMVYLAFEAILCNHRKACKLKGGAEQRSHMEELSRLMIDWSAIITRCYIGQAVWYQAFVYKYIQDTFLRVYQYKT